MAIRPSVGDLERKALLRARLVQYGWEDAKSESDRRKVAARRVRELADRSPS